MNSEVDKIIAVSDDSQVNSSETSYVLSNSPRLSEGTEFTNSQINDVSSEEISTDRNPDIKIILSEDGKNIESFLVGQTTFPLRTIKSYQVLSDSVIFELLDGTFIRALVVNAQGDKIFVPETILNTLLQSIVVKKFVWNNF